jgi:hypothetical protein
MKRKHVVPRKTAVQMEQYCKAPTDDNLPKDGVIFDEEVRFDGHFMVIQVCTSGDPQTESCWTQGVLFDRAGNECGCTDVGESFLGEYQVDHDGTTYIVEVVAAPVIEETWEPLCHISKYDAVEVAGVREVGICNGEIVHEREMELTPDLYSVFMHKVDGGVECVGDFAKFGPAWKHAQKLAGAQGWPAFNFVAKEHQ